MTVSAGDMIRTGLAWLAVQGERRQYGVAYHPLSARMAQDPYPVYAAIRARSRVHRSRLLQAPLFTRYADADAILRDHRTFGTDPRKAALTARQRRHIPPAGELTMLTLDPPDHTRLRALVGKAFTPWRIAALEPRIRAIMGSLLDAVDDPSGFDLITAIAQPLPVTVIAELLGIPAADRDRFKRWSAARARHLEPTVSRRERRAAAAASQAFNAYSRALFAERRRTPRDDILSALVQAEDGGERLSEQEMLNLLRLLLVGGNETAANLIGNGLLALLRHPAELARLRADPGLIPRAVEELLRFDAPIQTTFRRVLADGEVNGVPVRRRETLAVSLGAANRDPAAFPDPHRLDVGREGRPHLAFSRGIHHCLGAPLARLEGRIALELLLERFKRIELLDPAPRFRRTVVLRGLHALPLRCTRA